ncbi:hypothetical protein GCK72_000112 [Caenorhabditis remanei]|uniref:Uncharacterized protein n=1 Tax=Caenorhabditis remanei TaxID=31234 RepID=A0A6A5HJE4_CAERE|nr:hypothetical protein GCK72_000112 [Caenorhabditis remanei]KAF1768300.1 hypothetical protein GCK72_000112 [Caenorhabditis remanei]
MNHRNMPTVAELNSRAVVPRHVVGLLETVQRNVPEMRRSTRLAMRETRKRPRQQQQNGEGSSSSNVAPRPRHKINDKRNNLLNNTDKHLMTKCRRERFENFRLRMRLGKLRFEYKKTYGEVPIPDPNTRLKDRIDNLEREWKREREEAAAAPSRDGPVENRLE